MGRKVKVGKARKDKFYQLAKETGYRARSAFKLLQLNRKYEFLQKSRVCIDLCAAPGGWLQVAANHMPLSSLIVGVDLVPIRPIPKVSTLVDDITTNKCRQDLKKELQTWKADVVLHDGAPNVGKNWLHDAFIQAELTLSALKLATEFLRKGGWFVTKVFRSKDYQALMWVFQQLFKHVYATKPQASRNESAEIFVTCQGYLAPDKIDPKFTDAKYVFKEVDKDSGNLLNLVHPEKQKKQAKGYADGDYTLHHKVPVSTFITSENHLDVLADCNEIVFDDDKIKDHRLTTTEIQECCKDIKVLGKKEIRILLNWRKKINKEIEKKNKNAVEDVAMESAESEDEDSKMERQLEEMQAEQILDDKRKRKQVQREKRKLREKMSLNMIIPGDKIDQTDDVSLFNITRIKSKQGLEEVEKSDHMDALTDSEGEESDEEGGASQRKLRMSYERYQDEAPSCGDEDSDDEAEDDLSDDDDDDDAEDDHMEVEEVESNPLIVDLAEVKKTNKQAQLWFQKDVFSGLEGEDDEDLEIKKMTAEYTRKGGVILDKPTESLTKRKRKRQETDGAVVDTGFDSGHASDDSEDDESDEDDDDSDDDSNYDSNDAFTIPQNADSKVDRKQANKDGFEVVKTGQPVKKQKLDPIELAIGEELIKSSKRRREIIENSYNRHMHDDAGLPDWFQTEENKHNKKQYPVSKEQIQLYKDRMKAVDARPIKKIAEAKGRKKKKALRKLEKVRKKAENISETVDVTDKEKMHQIKQLYKKAGVLKNKKEEVTYVVGKKGVGRRVSRPAGVSGRFRVVDSRMKKDKTKQKMESKSKGRKGKKTKGKSRR